MGMTILLFTTLFLIVIGVITYLDAGDDIDNEDLDHITYHRNGSISVDPVKLLRKPEVQDQLKAMHGLYMRQTILALWQGERPPHSVGGYGTLTKKKLIIEWNDDWQAEMDELEESYDISYNILFDIQPEKPAYTYNPTAMLEDYFFAEREPKEHPLAGTFLTANEIAEQYGSEEKNEKS